MTAAKRKWALENKEKVRESQRKSYLKRKNTAKYKEQRKKANERRKAKYKNDASYRKKRQEQRKKSEKRTGLCRFKSLQQVCKKENINTEFKSWDDIYSFLKSKRDEKGLIRCHLSAKVIDDKMLKSKPYAYFIDRIGNKRYNGDGKKGGDYVQGNIVPAIFEYNYQREQLGLTVDEYRDMNYMERMRNLGYNFRREDIEKAVIKSHKRTMRRKHAKRVIEKIQKVASNVVNFVKGLF